MNKFVLKLYVSGHTPRSERVIANLHRVCREKLQDRYELIIIDVLEQPQMAEQEKIIATPTLVKKLPLPLRRIIGDLSEIDEVLLGLDLKPITESESHG